MNTRKILIASVAALAMGVGTSGVAATDTPNPTNGSGTTQTGPGPGPMMQAGQGPGLMGQNGRAGGMMGGQPGNAANMMADGPRSRSAGEGYGMRGSIGPGSGGMMGAGIRGEGMMDGGMLGGGMMGGGMMGMTGACSALSGSALDPKTAMQMRGEMMRAMGDILVKYADKIQPQSTRP